MRWNDASVTMRFGTARAVLSASVIAGALLLNGAGAARAEDGVGAQQVLDEIAAADRARSSQAAAEEDWERERRDLEALAATLETALKQLRERRAQRSERLSEVEGEIEKLEAESPPRAELDALLERVLKEAANQLSGLARTLLPGVIPPAQAGAQQPALVRLQDLMLRLQESEHSMRSWEIAILDGRRGGEEVAVKVLRCGAVAAWWRTLEGDLYGTAEWRDGVLHLSDAASPALRDGIAAAFAVFEGRRVPETVVLPFGHARREE